MDRTLITLIIDSTGKKIDLELPNNAPLIDIIEPMLRGINEWMAFGGDFTNCRWFINGGGTEWKSVQPTMSLQDLGVMDGYYLRIERVQSYSTVTNHSNNG